MLYRAVPKTGDRLSILGFGCMRLPTNTAGDVDEVRSIRQIRYAIDAGVNYLDTAPAYHLGKSEKVLGRALKDGYREKVRIATKLPHWEVFEKSDMDRILNRQLSVLQVDYIDYYLLHSLRKASFEKLKALGVFGFLEAAKNDGRIKNAGFSFHGNLPEFKEIVDSFDWQFCQIQYNYLDEKNQAGTEGLRYAAEKGLAVMIMEPLRGGNLAGRIPDDVSTILNEAPTHRSPAEWGLRWVWNNPEVTVVLSGMNDERHIDENIRTASAGIPGSLTKEETAIIGRVRDTFWKLMKVGCTGCGYCMPCPAGVDIPGCFIAYNAATLFPHDRTAKLQYISRHGGLMAEKSYAGLCRQCRRCEKACPQQLPIASLMKEVSGEMEGVKMSAVPLVKVLLWCSNRISRIRCRISKDSSTYERLG